MQELTVYSTEPSALELAGLAANTAARQNRLASYQAGVARETLRRQRADIALFEQYLAEAGAPTSGLFEQIERWDGVTWGLIEGFKEWQLQHGYAIRSVGVRLATVKRYTEIAAQSEVLDPQAYRLIQSVKMYRARQLRNLDEKRPVKRRGKKKAEPVIVSTAHIDRLKDILRADDSYLGRRDCLLLCLLAHQGLRCGEIRQLEVQNMDLAGGYLVFYRHKVDKTQTHQLHPATHEAALRYFEVARPQGYLFQGVDRAAWSDTRGKSYKGHALTDGLSTRAINERVQYLGSLVGLEGLSPHDLRHYWTSDAARNKTDLATLQQAGGWNSPIMPLHYMEKHKIANEGIKQSP